MSLNKSFHCSGGLGKPEKPGKTETSPTPTRTKLVWSVFGAANPVQVC